MKSAAELTQRLQDGSQEALFSLMAMYYNDLYRYGIKFTADKELTKDIIGQFFLHVWDRRDKFAKAENLQGYLLISFKRFTINYLRKISRQLNFSKEETSACEYPYEDYIIAWQEEETMKSSLLLAIESLPPRQRELLQLRFYDQLSYEEIASRTSLSIRTVYNKLHEALKKLRTHSILEQVRRNFLLLITVSLMSTFSPFI